MKWYPIDSYVHFIAICDGVCKNGGTCEVVHDSTECICKSGYYGSTCSECTYDMNHDDKMKKNIYD